MTRLLWKEWREGAWFAAAALAAPILLLLYTRHFSRAVVAWPRDSNDLLLGFVAFAVWGATRLPRERRKGQMTLLTLPAPRWRVWLCWAGPAAGAALIAAGLAVEFGAATCRIPGDARTYQMALGAVSGGLMLAYAAAFATSAVWHPAAGAVLGLVLGALGADAASGGIKSMSVPGAAAFLWGAALFALLTPLALPDWGARRYRASIVAAAFCAAAVWLSVDSQGISLDLLAYLAAPHGSESAPDCVISRAAGLVAFRHAGDARPMVKGSSASLDTLWVSRLDGSGRRLVARGDGLRPLAWTRSGRLIYEDRPKGRAEATWMLWEAGSPARTLAALRFPGSTAETPFVGSVAASPDGRWLAFVRPPMHAAYPAFDYVDLWAMDLRDGRVRLLCPAVSDAPIRWAGGRVFYERGGDPTSISPGGGKPRPETRMPAGTEDTL